MTFPPCLYNQLSLGHYLLYLRFGGVPPLDRYIYNGWGPCSPLCDGVLSPDAGTACYWPVIIPTFYK
jgi:hypothetical protein